MYGYWRVDEERDGKTPRPGIKFDRGFISLYNCSVKYISRDVIDVEYLERRDILSHQCGILKKLLN
jgi:hypothetical protein